MTSITVLLFVESRYRLNRKRIKKTITSVLESKHVEASEGTVEVSVAIVGDRKMHMLNKKYRGFDKTTNVLSFPLGEGEQTHASSDGTLRLGDIVISYPQVIREAAAEEVMVDDKIEELVEHSLMHLLGIHHE